MAKYRRDRINDSVAKELAVIIPEVKDPRVSESFITITGAEVSPDLKYAKIYYSFLGGEEKEIRTGLKSAAGFMRSQLAKRLNLRVTPELTFVYDDSALRGVHIASVINSFTYSDDGNETPDEEEETSSGADE